MTLIILIDNWFALSSPEQKKDTTIEEGTCNCCDLNSLARKFIRTVLPYPIGPSIQIIDDLGLCSQS